MRSQSSTEVGGRESIRVVTNTVTLSLLDGKVGHKKRASGVRKVSSLQRASTSNSLFFVTLR